MIIESSFSGREKEGEKFQLKTLTKNSKIVDKF